MDKLIDEAELSDLIKKDDLTYYQICSEFPGKYDEALENNALEVIKAAVEVNYKGLRFFATMSIKDKPYGLRAGYIISPSLLKDEIVYDMPNAGWVLVKVKQLESYGAY